MTLKLDLQLENILKLERLKECFELRLYYLKTGYCKKTEYEKNEIDILELTTEAEITKINKSVVPMTDNFCQSLYDYVSEPIY
jgi:hypothetical protein